MQGNEVVNSQILKMKPVKSTQGDGPFFPKGALDPLYLAYFYLLEATNITTESTLLHVKQLNQNAAAQQRLDNEAAALQWFYLPALQSHKKRVCVGTRTSWSLTANGQNEVDKHYKVYKTEVTHPNQTAVAQAQAQNQQVSAERQQMSQKLMVLQQNAQIGENYVNSISDEAANDRNMAANILHAIEDLTFKALMADPPSN